MARERERIWNASRAGRLFVRSVSLFSRTRCVGRNGADCLRLGLSRGAGKDFAFFFVSERSCCFLFPLANEPRGVCVCGVRLNYDLACL